MAFAITTRKKKKHAIDEELQLVPFIDMFAVLLTFLLITATILQTAIIELSLPTAAGTGSNTSDVNENLQQPLTLSVIITDKGLTIGGSGAILPMIAKKGGNYDFDELSRQLGKIKEKFSAQTQVIIVCEPNIIYDNIIKTMDCCLEAGFPEISLSGQIV